jgi:multidrug efflux pump
MVLVESVMHAAKQRLRPILMTSLAFMSGVLPLAISSGAGSGAQHAVGTGVIGGMLTSTFLAVFFVPVFFVVVLGYFHVDRTTMKVDEATADEPYASTT